MSLLIKISGPSFLLGAPWGAYPGRVSVNGYNTPVAV